jgi:LPXTG-motif cell wall-anchored protein
VKLDDGTVYTIFAVGLAGGEPALQALPSVDAAHGAATSGAAGEMPEELPKTGAGDYLPLLGAIAAVSIAAGLILRKRDAVTVRR